MPFSDFIVAAGVHGPAGWLEERGLPRLAAVLITYLALIALLVTMLILAVPPLLGQLSELARDLPEIGQMLVDRLRPILDLFGVQWDATRALEFVAGQLGDLSGALTGLPLAVITVVGNLVTIMFLSALMLLERDRAQAWSLRFVAESDRETVVDLAHTLRGIHASCSVRSRPRGHAVTI